jgi:hypothetical protein
VETEIVLRVLNLQAFITSAACLVRPIELAS